MNSSNVVQNNDPVTANTPDTVQQLVYGISHDMGAPLRAVVQFSQLLEKRLDTRLDEKERYWLQLVQQGGEKGQAMIEALLRYSRLNRASTARTILIEEVVKECTATLTKQRAFNQYSAANNSVQITSDLPVIKGYPDHWNLFFLNIIDNALLYRPKNDENDDIKIQVYSETKGKTNKIIIDDNGIGVPENQLDEITRPFMRAQTEEDYPGIGMGLCYCERIAEIHGGKLDFAISPLGGLRVIYSYTVE